MQIKEVTVMTGKSQEVIVNKRSYGWHKCEVTISATLDDKDNYDNVADELTTEANRKVDEFFSDIINSI